MSDASNVPPRNLVFLLDVDNTLLDNDRVAADLKRFLIGEVGEQRAQQYWEIFEEIRADILALEEETEGLVGEIVAE